MSTLKAYTISQGLTTSKATERKENVAQLRELLRKPAVIVELDSKPKYWNEILKNVIQYVYIESDSIRKSKASASSQATSNKKRDTASLFKFVVNTANKRDCLLKCETIVKHISHVLKEDFLRESFGLIYSSLLLKDILSIRKYINDINHASPSIWLDLLYTYCDIFQSDSNSLNNSLVIKLIYALMQAVSLQTELPTDELFKFYLNFFKTPSNKKANMKVLEYILLSANHFVQQSAVNNQHQMCLLGESAIQLLLNFWSQQNQLQQQILVFLSFQLRIHNPSGARTKEEGAFAADWAVWKSYLKKMYKIVHNYLEEFNSRHTLSSSSRDSVTVLGKDLVQFAADLYHQMFYITSSSTSTDDSESGIVAKKQRLESGLSELREKISSVGANKKVIPWLQLMHCLLERHPSDFQDGEAQPLLQVLSQFQSDAKRCDVTELLLSCLQILASVLTTEYADIWTKVWDNCLKKISLQHCQDSNFKLMSTLLHHHCVNFREDIWKFFTSFYMTPTKDSVQFLATYCHFYDLPEYYQSELLTRWVSVVTSPSSSNPSNHLYFLRKALIDWLLPSWEDKDEETSTVSSMKQSFEMTDCNLIASLLITLLLSPVAVDPFCRHLPPSTASNSSPSLVESLYLKMTFYEDQTLTSTMAVPTNNDQNMAKCPLLTVIEHFLTRIDKLVLYIQNLNTDDNWCIQKASYISCLLSKCLAYIANRGMNELSELHSNLSNQLQTTLTKLEEFFHRGRNVQVRSKYINEAVPFLCQYFSADNIDQSYKCQHFDLVRSLMPKGVLDSLIAVVKEQILPSSVNRQSERFLTLESESPASCSGNNTLDDIFDEDDDANNEFKESAMKDAFSQVLSPEETLCCQTMQLLCLWHSYNKQHTSYLSDNLQNKIMEILENLNIMKSFHLQMFQTIVSTLCSTHQHLTESNLECLMLTVRNIMKQHWRDPAIYQKCIHFLSMILPHLSGEEHDTTSKISEIRLNALQLFKIIWSLQGDKKYNTSVRLSLATCLHTFIKIDPEGKWAVDSTDDTGDPLWKFFPTFLTDPCFHIRYFCASNITCLFRTEDKTGRNYYLSQNQQESSFREVYKYSEENLTVLDSNQCVQLSRTSSFLLAMSTIICNCPLYERKAIYICCSQSENISVDFVKKVLTLSAIRLKHKSLQDLMVIHLPFLVNKWLNDDLPIRQFPYQLLECSSEVDFYTKYTSVCLPLVAVVRAEAGIQESLAHLLGERWFPLHLQECLVTLLVHILPYLAVLEITETVEDKVKDKISQAKTNYQTLLQYFTEEDIENCLKKNVSDFIVQLLLCLDEKPDNVLTPNPNPPYYKRDVIMTTLQYLANNFSSSITEEHKPTLVHYLSLHADHFWKILLLLGVHLNSCSQLSEQYRLMCSYHLFVDLLLQEFDTKLGDCHFYIFREVLCRILYLIERLGQQIKVIQCCNDEKYIEATIELALKLLLQFNFASSTSFSKEFSKFLPQIVKTLMPYCCGYTFSHTVLNLLESMIFNDNYEKGILELDPFPKSETLQKFRKRHQSLKYKCGKFSLQQEIEWFLKTGKDVTLYRGTRSVESLKFLHKQLQKHTHKFRDLIVQDGSEDIVCQLVQELACIIQNGSGEVAEAAALCLGIIGPVDISLWTSSSQLSRNLYQDQSQLENLPVYQENTKQQKYFQIFYLLNQYLVDSCMTTVQCAAQVLRSMLSTKAGRQFKRNNLQYVPFFFKSFYPFLKSKGQVTTKDPSKSINIDNEELWNPSHSNHSDWIINLTCSLIQSDAVEDEMLQVLGPICQVKTEFCELVLPYLVHDICLNQEGDIEAVLTQHINNFFVQHSSISNSPNVDVTSKSTGNTIKICMNKQSVQKMLNVVQYLRQQPRTTHTAKKSSKRSENCPQTSWQNNFWLDLDYSHIAKAANFCSAHFTAILYSEIWWYAQMESQEEKSSAEETNGRFQDSLAMFASLTDNHVKVQGTLLKAYREIGDPDGPYGCGAGTLSDPTSRIQFYEHENQWKKAIVSYDILMTEPEPTVQLGMLKSLHKCGLNHILGTYLNKLDSSISPELQELQYEAAWRTAQWNLDVPTRLSTSWDFHKSLYAAMTYLSRNQEEPALEAVHFAKLSVMRTLRESSLESCSPLYLALSRLACLAQLTEMLELDRDSNTKSNKLHTLLEKWEIQRQIWRADFEFVEPVQHLCCVLLSVCGEQPGHQLDGLARQYQNLIKAACQDGKYEIAERCLYLLDELKKKHTLEQSVILQTEFERANFLWKRGEQTTAKNLMKTIIIQLEGDAIGEVCSEIAQLYPSALNTYGNWLAETRSENPKDIMQFYLAKAVSKLQGTEPNKSNVAIEAHASLANYAHQQYRNIRSYMNSRDFGVKKDLMKDAQRDVRELCSLEGNVNKRFVSTLQRQSDIDEAEVSAATEDCDKFLQQAIVNFLKCLHFGDHHNLHIFTFVSLWFDNARSPNVTKLLRKYKITYVKTCKFLPLMYQLAARMDSHETPFQILLNEILSKVTQDHPHHVLPIIMALANSHEDNQYLQVFKTKTETHTDGEGLSYQNRVNAAKQLLNKLSKSKIGDCVREMMDLCKAYIELAYFSVQKFKIKTGAIPLPDSLELNKQKNLCHVAVATAFIPVQQDGNYSDIPYIIGFDNTFKLAGGINLPKIIQCRGSNGKSYKQLVKGRDDLRQDAVMQQVFGLVNELLNDDPDARKRQLKIRTYKVIPLSQRSGLLEWCEGTQPLGEYLIAKDQGAHQKYRPKDWTAGECRQKLTSAKSLAQKRATYTEICQHFHPVMRHFFFEKFLDPVQWYECHVAYIKSVATNSIVGYILGLGDRHVLNILIDCTKAELVHIDLGIAFEQGKILPTPETVPFRLTRDIVDGMGVCGVEGIFRRCCEKTMLVMHTNQQSLITILQVLLYDPLYNWTLSPSKANQLQQLKELKSNPVAHEDNCDGVTDDEPDKPNVNRLAERVLLRLQQKLQGIEDGIQLSLGGQVNHLIQEAQNPDNLCKLYPGWQPYV
ncbi:serine-protein kinase ATM isoform X1 [Octopus sinensis]|uniref:non-specific serine/threonine protein kinase n=1 Tax=Octopus sinensis TaxID=2607531 RepID=A0A6P7U399_9MOLL|nr:serine-protein kinase ATM isoform X1 [Octopus sinensis]XP_036356500.1 serine-protein kinase ATM isoform X1 [Octopus sinensis]XP_036356501.1 serine-protein kinase ATM isoform X1 [Octopus sinensis]